MEDLRKDNETLRSMIKVYQVNGTSFKQLSFVKFMLIEVQQIIQCFVPSLNCNESLPEPYKGTFCLILNGNTATIS